MLRSSVRIVIINYKFDWNSFGFAVSKSALSHRMTEPRAWGGFSSEHANRNKWHEWPKPAADQ